MVSEILEEVMREEKKSVSAERGRPDTPSGGEEDHKNKCTY